ncbi:MAG: ATP-binding cassette domain-containing protein [Bacteroidales bacterium]|nr:ATP-binding cassette domain-containing protein [Bacteroidales bacterium]
MNEKILDALMRLFALITDPTDIANNKGARVVVEAYLRGFLSPALVDEYIVRFDKYLNDYQDRKSSGKATRKNISVNSVKVLKICELINQQLHHREKVYVLIQLMEYVCTDSFLTSRERDFVETVSQAFNIDHSELKNLEAFIENDISQADVPQNFLIIDSLPYATGGARHVTYPGLDGVLRILLIESISGFFFIYQGMPPVSINGRKVQNGKVYRFENGGIIRGQKLGSVYQSNTANIFMSGEDIPKVTFTGIDVQFTYKNYDNGLKPFSFSLESGNMVGIMGGSGTGKSTLLNVLTGKYKLDKGDIYINGHNVVSPEAMPEGIIGIVPQDDLLIAELTVWQNLYYNSKLCLGNLPEKELVEHVEKVLMDLDLYDIRNLHVGDALNNVISGGQRKRLNIALELVREPAILFVDEPTSGLSSTDSETVMHLLKQQALNGKIVVVNIHQPSSKIFKMFDKLWVMDKGGYVIYNGSPMEAVSYFKTLSDYVDAGESECPVCGNVNSEEILQIVEARVVDQYGHYTQERRVSPQEWHQKFTEINDLALEDYDMEETPLPDTKFSIPTKWSQFKVFITRNVLSKLSNNQYMAITFLESPVLAFILGFFTKYINDEGEYVFADNRNLPVFLFMIVVVALFTGLTCSAEEIIRDRKILEREKFLNLSRFSYISSKVFVVFIISAIQTLTFILVGNLILEIKGMLWSYWFVMFTTACAANMIGLLISSALNSVIAIYVLIPFILVPQMLLGGAMIDFDDLHESVSDKINVPFIGDLMVSRWSYEALAVDQFQNNVYEREFYELDEEKSRDIYLSTYLMSELDNIASRCIKISEKASPTADEQEELEDLLLLLKNEIEYLNYRNPAIYFDHTADITPERFNTMIGNFLQLFLRAQKEFYNEAAEKVNSDRQHKLHAMELELGKDGLYQLQKDYYNDKLAELVLNKRAVKKFYYAPNHRLIQKKDPIFMEPVSDWGRAHFYAPCKIIKNHRIPTYFFNMTMLWMWTVMMFFILLWDFPRKVVNFVSGVYRLRKNRKKLTAK